MTCLQADMSLSKIAASLRQAGKTLDIKMIG